MFGDDGYIPNSESDCQPIIPDERKDVYGCADPENRVRSSQTSAKTNRAFRPMAVTPMYTAHCHNTYFPPISSRALSPA